MNYITFIVSSTMLAGYALSAPRTIEQSGILSTVSGCKGKPAELLFLLDSSSSIWSVDFTKQLHFVSELVESFAIGPNHTRVGVSSFSYKYRSNIDLGEYDNVKDLKTAIEEIPQSLGGTYTYDALDGVRTSGLSEKVVRPGVVKIVIVLTDGKSYNERKTKDAAMRLKKEAVVFAVGIGSRTDREELTSIASEPTEEYLFEVGNYGLLKTIKEALAITACEAALQEALQDAANPVPACGAKNTADVMFLMETAELGGTNAAQIYDFIGDLTTDFSMVNGNIQVGVESSYCGNSNVNLGEYKDSTDLSIVLRNTKISGLGNMIRRLRTHAYEEENGGRATARHMAVVFVDDQLFDPKDVLDQARRSKHYDVELFVVAIGDSVVDRELALMCSSPLDRHLIRVPSYDSLSLAKPEFLKKFCLGL